MLFKERLKEKRHEANMVNFIENDGRVVLTDYSTESIYVD